MERLNALEWADGLCFVAYGLRIGVRVTVSELLPELLEMAPPDWRPSSTRNTQWMYSLSSVPSRRKPGATLHQLYTGGTLVTRGSDFRRVRRAFAEDLRLHLAVHSPWRVFIHAGAVGWKGKAIVMPGNAGSGKTRLTAALVKAGATLLSDEHAILDRKGRVHPYPLPLRMREKGHSRWSEVSAEALGGEAQARPLPVGLILSTRYDPAGPVRPRRMSEGRAALALMAHAVQARLRPGRVMETAGRAAAAATFRFQGRRGEADEIVDTLLNLW